MAESTILATRAALRVKEGAGLAGAQAMACRAQAHTHAREVHVGGQAQGFPGFHGIGRGIHGFCLLELERSWKDWWCDRRGRYHCLHLGDDKRQRLVLQPWEKLHYARRTGVGKSPLVQHRLQPWRSPDSTGWARAGGGCCLCVRCGDESGFTEVELQRRGVLDVWQSRHTSQGQRLREQRRTSHIFSLPSRP